MLPISREEAAQRVTTPARYILPQVLGGKGIASDEARQHMLLEVCGDGQLAAIQRGIAQTVQTFVGFNAQRDEVAIGTRNNQAGCRSS